MINTSLVFRASRTFSILFPCLFLLLGGAERLVVNIACALLKLGHTVTIMTSHHDPDRCFEETKKDGKEKETFLPKHSKCEITPTNKNNCAGSFVS